MDKSTLKLLKQIGLTKDEIEMVELRATHFKNWTPITFNELKEMNEKELKKLMSYCWKNGEYRCKCIGISDVNIVEKKSIAQTANSKKILITYWTLSYSDQNGDPHFTTRDLSEYIDNVGDGEWNYGLYRKKKKNDK